MHDALAYARQITVNNKNSGSSITSLSSRRSIRKTWRGNFPFAEVSRINNFANCRKERGRRLIK